ncbi:autotransporter outer membrane beta-barrel domain-containing protein, partial [Escherichia sp. SS-MK2]
HLRTELGDDNSATDKVVINGNTSGTTRVKVTNAGGSGAYTLNGIEIISVEGESNGEFIKDSRIFAGAYEYSLTRGNTEATNKNWYLTNFQ